MNLENLKKILKDCGVAGAGGAGFPTYAKLDSRADTVILNCAECEPLFKVHRQLLYTYAHEIVQTLAKITEALGAKRFIVAVKKEYTKAAKAAQAEIENYSNGSVFLLGEFYPAGDEVVTIFEATGRRVPAGNIPISVGVIVLNAETVLNSYFALEYGTGVSFKHVTVAGAVKNPSTVRVPIGTSFKALIDFCGGYTGDDDDFEIICGGPMTGRLAEESQTVTKTTNGVIVLPRDHQIINAGKVRSDIAINRAKSACCQCRSCTDLCPRTLLGQPVNPHDFMRALSSGADVNTKVMTNALYCVSCGVCELYACPQGLSPRNLITEFKQKMAQNGVKPKALSQPAEEISPARDMRRVPMNRLKQRLSLNNYDVDAPLNDKFKNPPKLKVMLSQHIGAPAVANVKKGDKVAENAVIATATENALSLPVHAPLAGTVKEVTDKFVVIEVD